MSAAGRGGRRLLPALWLASLGWLPVVAAAEPEASAVATRERAPAAPPEAAAIAESEATVGGAPEAGAVAGAEGAAPLPDVAAPMPEAAGPASGAPELGELTRVQTELDARRGRLEAFLQRQEGLLDTLADLDAAEERVERALARARRELEAAEVAFAEAEARHRVLAAAREPTQRALAARARALLREGATGPLRWLAGADGLRDLLARARALRRGMEQDAALLARSRAEAAALAQARARAEARARSRDAARARLVGRAGELESERATKRELLAAVRHDAERERSAVAELEAAARALTVRLRALGAEPPASAEAPVFASLRGRLPPPVEAPLARGFGREVDARFRTALFRKGVDFAAPRGAPVRAVAGGVVRYAGWFRGYGKLVILDHGHGYFTVSGHLDAIDVAVGESIEPGARLGTVGETGSLAGPVLYFEIRQGSEPLDPERWLARVPGLD